MLERVRVVARDLARASQVTVSGPAGRRPTLTAYGKKSFGPWPTIFA